MSLERVRVAMVGAGGMANRVHYPSLASFADVEFAGICDLDATRLDATADSYGIERRYSDYRRMVEETAPDAVYVIGPPHLMFDIWVWMLQQGQNLCIEKPLGITLHQAQVLAHLAEAHHCITQVSFQRRSCPMVVALREACVARGPIRHATCEFYKAEPKPFLMARDHMMDDGVHAIDTLRWLCGGEVVRVQGVTRRWDTPDINYFSALLEFDNGAVGVLMNQWTSGRRIFRVAMHAPGICAEAEHEGTGRLFVEGDTQGIAYDSRTFANSDEFHVFGGFEAKNRQFIDAVKRGIQPESNFADALKTMQVAEMILAQALLAERS
jgi:predicted dehydrogenase